ncbi:MAG TPA: ATP-binding cassette domain-containing protein [Syntrophaceae bacterium]|nr:ATP-binding cassette domain-containing protein [Syntrophaceae bacterium]
MDVVVEARNLVKEYNSHRVVKGINFSVCKGECFGFLGPNGAGKTTTMSMIICYTPITKGNVTVFGLDVGRYPKKVKQKIGVIPQETNLDPDLTVFENLMVYARYFNIPKKVARNRVKELLSFVQLSDKRDEVILRLSGGMKRRLLIARSLINDPELIILDEPTIGLDPQARHLIWQKLRQLKAHGTTMVLSTHYMEEAAQLCDRLAIMDQGQIIAEGSPNHLITEFVGTEVIEIRSDGQESNYILDSLKEHQFSFERAADTLFLYSREGGRLVQKIKEVKDERIIYRPATLEDVFLKLTGRELKE